MFVRLGCAAAAVALAALAQQPELDHFETKVRPILASRCYSCHSQAMPAPQGGLLLDSARGIRKGGNSGVAIVPGDPDRSLLVLAIRHSEDKLKMPPGKPLSPEVIADFEQWVRSGAPLPTDQPNAPRKQVSLWSLRPPQPTTPPAVRNEPAVRNDIDRFLLNRLETANLSFSPEADKRTLIRRATYDLTGLPPSAEDVEQFVRDQSPSAYEQLIDRLLASPRYGERWARHWLDVARYADSANDSVNTSQRFPWSYTYRDWVVRALNDDLPYDRFVLYQLAADLIPEAGPQHVAALGYLSLGREFPNSYAETVDDRIDAVTRGLLGLTVSCARCHDHKYDPIPTKDYYSLYSILSNIRQPRELPLLKTGQDDLPKQSLYQKRLDHIQQVYQDYRRRRHTEMVAFFKSQTAEYLIAAHDAEPLSNPAVEELVRERQLNAHVLARWRKYLRASKSSGEPVFRAWHVAAAVPAAEFATKWPTGLNATGANPLVQAALAATPAGKLQDVAKAYAELLVKYDRDNVFSGSAEEQLRAVLRGPTSPADLPLEEFELICTEGDNNNLRSIRVRYNSMLSDSAYEGAAARAMAVEDVPDPKPVAVFVRGNPSNPGALAPPHFLSCLGGSEDKPFRHGSGRLELAQSVVDPANPLTARVIVNRVWMHHFGSALVPTPSDFGFRGDPPKHPELLDYLATRFVKSGWSLKRLHRDIMMSAAYRQSSQDSAAGRKADPENQLVWRMNRRRLEIESLRDSMLAVAGRLDLTTGGVPFPLTAQPSVPRRSVYGFIERGRVPAMLSAFDFASPDQHAPLRYTTTVPQQALFFLNSPFVIEQAGHIAARPRSTSSEDKIRELYRAIFTREPQEWEIDAGLRFIADSASAESAPLASRAPWFYGTATVGSEIFKEFEVFVSDRWQGDAVLPSQRSGNAVLRATGGEPGEHHAVIRRWVSTVAGRASIEGTLRHGQPAVPYGDGVRGRIVSSRHGELASWSVNGSSAETRLNGIAVEQGDTIDFIVDARRDPENDGFGWAPIIKIGEQVWNAKNQFSGPTPRPASVWARYVQVLLQTNEFSFVD